MFEIFASSYSAPVPLPPISEHMWRSGSCTNSCATGVPVCFLVSAPPPYPVSSVLESHLSFLTTKCMSAPWISPLILCWLRNQKIKLVKTKCKARGKRALAVNLVPRPREEECQPQKADTDTSFIYLLRIRAFCSLSS